jgi:hypothetical protein
MIDQKKLEEELNGLPEDSIILLETSADTSLETSMASIKLLVEKNDKGIILSANRPYSNLMNLYEKNDIDTSKMIVLDLISKNPNVQSDTEKVVFLENISALTDISLSLNDCMKTIQGKKFVFIDSITTMLIHNQPYVFARFIHSILTKMRLNGVGGILVSLDTKTNKDVRAEIAQLCDKVIKI